MCVSFKEEAENSFINDKNNMYILSISKKIIKKKDFIKEKLWLTNEQK